MILLIWCNVVCYVTHATRACPFACDEWNRLEKGTVGPALGETVCYHNATCYHPENEEHCPSRWKRCMRADDENFWE